MQELPGERTTFYFLDGVPAPLNFALAILLNQKMLTIPEKFQTAPALLPMLLEGQSFGEEQDDVSILEFMRKYGMPERINEEVFISMAKVLDFIDPDKMSMTVVLTAMDRFLNETYGLQSWRPRGLLGRPLRHHDASIAEGMGWHAVLLADRPAGGHPCDQRC